MKKKKIFHKKLLWGSIVILLGVLVYYFFTFRTVFSSFFSPSYTGAYYRMVEDLFNDSQYRLKEPTAIIPDEIVYSYASGAYVRGVDPIYINSEHTPLGKYLIGVGIVLFQNDKIMVFMCFVLTLVILWFLSYQVLHKNIFLATLSTGLFAIERVFTDQLIYAPLLDIIQLPFILASVLLYIYEEKKGNFIWTSIMIGLTMATKSIVPGVLLYGIFILHRLYLKKYTSIGRLLVYSPLAFIVLILSYTKTFVDGYSVFQFIGFQKWIFLYQKSKLEYPFSFWRFIYCNQWQAWWGDRAFLRGEDWRISWPVIVSLPFIQVIYASIRKIQLDSNSVLLLIYIGCYELFLSTGVVSSRFFLPLFPMCYIVSVYVISQLIVTLCKLRK